MDPRIIFEDIMRELAIDEFALKSTLSLLGKGATVPFIARYRKEKTGGLNEVQIRAVQERFAYYSELEARKDEIKRSIKSQGKFTPELEKAIDGCRDRFRLEDLYLPFKQKERTRAVIARERGLEELARLIFDIQPVEGDKEAEIARFVDLARLVPSAEDAVGGAIDIVAERIAEDAAIRGILRDHLLSNGVLVSRGRAGSSGEKTKYEAYYQFAQALSTIPPHRLLAIRRGAKERALSWEIEVPEGPVLQLIEAKVAKRSQSIFRKELRRAVEMSYRLTLKTAVEIDLFRMKLKAAEADAMKVFSRNLENLLLAPPAGEKTVMGIDPGIATGCKIAVVDRNGNFVEFEVVYLHGSAQAKADAEDAFEKLVRSHRVELVAVGNGTGSKEAYAFAKETVRKRSLPATVTSVSEAGASVYSASDTARAEFPDLDITIRGAISIARRLQDPLADLVKIDPKSIGVGQYQHDVYQADLKRSLEATVESCVNYVGVELNTASVELLSYVSGIGPELAKSIVSYRKSRGSFASRADFAKVPGVSEKVFEFAAGFLKVRGSKNPLDRTTIHPESYHIVEAMAKDLGAGLEELLGNEPLARKIDLKRYVTAETGLPTLEDIVYELEKPGFDPREEFSSVEFNAAINEISDLQPGMLLEGVVTNVTDFGAFVDIGVHQDGLVHISKMSDRFVKDPHDVLSVGERIKVRVASIDTQLKRVSLERAAKERAAPAGAGKKG